MRAAAERHDRPRRHNLANRREIVQQNKFLLSTACPYRTANANSKNVVCQIYRNGCSIHGGNPRGMAGHFIIQAASHRGTA